MTLSTLIQGYRDFRQHYFEGSNVIFERLVREGQSPKTLIIACSDSRVDPAIVMNCQPGDLFVVRNVANLVPPYEDDNGYHGTSAAMEFAVCELNIEHIIVLGHSQCGGIRALMERGEVLKKRHFIRKWMEIAQPAYEKTCASCGQASLETKVDTCSQYGLVNSLSNLQTFPWIRERMAAGKLTIHAWFFNLSCGTLSQYDSATEQFVELDKTA